MKGITDLIVNIEVNEEVVADVEHTSLPPVVAGPALHPACLGTLAFDLHLGEIKSTRSLPGDNQGTAFAPLIVDFRARFST